MLSEMKYGYFRNEAQSAKPPFSCIWHRKNGHKPKINFLLRIYVDFICTYALTTPQTHHREKCRKQKISAENDMNFEN